jgi:hypothetical protein
MMDVAAAAIAFVFGIWLVLSVAHQTPERWELKRWIARRDPFGLVPEWTFFAPTPGTADTFLMYRVFEDGRWQRWLILPMASRRSLLTVVWHPQRRRVKALFDIVNSLSRVAAQRSETPRAVCLSTGYLALLGITAAKARCHERATACQFAVASVDVRSVELRAELVIQSESHPLAAPGAR